jgi:hypothetical protein
MYASIASSWSLFSLHLALLLAAALTAPRIKDQAGDCLLCMLRITDSHGRAALM